MIKVTEPFCIYLWIAHRTKKCANTVTGIYFSGWLIYKWSSIYRYEMLTCMTSTPMFSWVNETQNELMFLSTAVKCWRLTQSTQPCTATHQGCPFGRVLSPVSQSHLPSAWAVRALEVHLSQTRYKYWSHSMGSAAFKELHISLNQTDYNSSEPNWQNLTAFMFH